MTKPVQQGAILLHRPTAPDQGDNNDYTAAAERTPTLTRRLHGHLNQRRRRFREQKHRHRAAAKRLPKQAGGTPCSRRRGMPLRHRPYRNRVPRYRGAARGRKREQSWELYFQWEAADLLQNMVEGVQKGITPEALSQ